MSVQSEIDRIRKNVGDTLSIIGGKGVVIPEGAGSNEFPALVGALGPQLPALTDPGTAADLARGKELIGADGTVVKGSVNVVLWNTSHSCLQNNTYNFEIAHKKPPPDGGGGIRQR